MNIILTRPLIDTEDLMSKLFLSGHKIIHIPTLKISSAEMKPIDTEKYDTFIFTSSNAVRNLKFLNKNYNINCFCVGLITEKIVRTLGFTNTFSAGGTVNALKNLIISSDKINRNSKIAYICGDNITLNLDQELSLEGFNIKKIINYRSKKITELNAENNKLIKEFPPNLIFVYSKRSAESFNEIVKNYSLAPMMTQSIVKCISKNIADIFKKFKWQKIEVFNPGEEIQEIEKYK
tara:strand:- start:13797 stop:14501 length:705 start_codon:yes stop_codon:yes gene_type:complete